MIPTVTGGRLFARITIAFGLITLCWHFDLPFLNILFSLFMLRIVAVFLGHICGSRIAGYVFLATTAPLVVIAALKFTQLQLVPYFAVIAVNLIMTYVFGNSLLRGKPTVLLQFVRTGHQGPEASAEFAGFLSRQCAFWVIISLISAGLASVAMISPVSRPVAGTVLYGLFVLQILWFCVSHKVAQYRFQRPETWQQSLALMTQRDTWQKLEL